LPNFPNPTNAEIKLYVIPWSHYCRKVSVALVACDVPHSLVDVIPFGAPPRDPDFKRKPGQTYPTLLVRDNGEEQWTVESTEALAVVDALPRGPAARLKGSMFKGFRDNLGQVPGDEIVDQVG
jgi:glutathione S-transferase